MKYIRTKKGIYEFDEDKGEFVNRENKHIKTGDVIAQADTIEELCDEFVCISKNEHTVVDKGIKPSQILKNIASWHWKERVEIYGAIWTDKGLIYVAKMNEKGELELI